MNPTFATQLSGAIDAFKRDGVYKRLNYLESPQAAHVRMEGHGDVLILSSNNYLGLSAEPAVVKAGKDALDTFGVHAVGGTLGAFITGIFATADVNGNLNTFLKDVVEDDKGKGENSGGFGSA